MFAFLKTVFDYILDNSIIVLGPQNEVLVVEYFGG